MGQVEQYRLDDIARRRLHELEYRGSVSRDAEEELVPKELWIVNYRKVLEFIKSVTTQREGICANEWPLDCTTLFVLNAP